MSDERKANLRRAIRNARGPAQCMYVFNGKPWCVIGQLASLEGVTVESLSEWVGFIELIDDSAAKSLLDRYGTDLLSNLQGIWDDDDETAATKRFEMRELVNEAELPALP